jgi:lipopolysaccharide/colanic/teichoic acid biosynthesis glycosyltransferase/O-antigen/teichoic acid export membrane protein
MHGKRALDLAVCLLLLPIAVPAMSVIAVAVLISSGRPVFYHATRMGRGGRAFAMLKFRTMRSVTGPAITRADDSRVTRIGRPLRRTKLDEMPSLLNVLRGDMSLVGPRPEDPRYLPYYSTEERKVLSVSPGITGPTALRFRDEEQLLSGVPAEHLEYAYTSLHLHEKLRLDLDYIRRRSLATDLAILGRTALVPLRRSPVEEKPPANPPRPRDAQLPLRQPPAEGRPPTRPGRPRDAQLPLRQPPAEGRPPTRPGRPRDAQLPRGRHRRKRSAGAALLAGIGLNGLSQMIPLLVNFLLTPYLIKVLGVDGFGVWSLALVFLSTLTTLDGGVGASLTRFFAMHAARRDRAGATRLLIGAVLVFVLLAAVVTALAIPLAPVVVSHLHMGPQLREQAVVTFRWLGLLVGLGLLSDAAVAMLQANQRFVALTGTIGVSSLAYGVAVLLVLHPGAPLVTLVWLTAFRYAAIVVCGFGVVSHQLRLRHPLLPGSVERKEFGRYAIRMQLTSLTAFFNGEIDAFIIAALFPVRYVGLYSAGYMAASVARSLPLYAFPPILTRLAGIFTHEGLSGAQAEFESLEAVWLPLVLGYGAVATCAVGFGVPIWLGTAYRLAGVVGAVLMAGYTVHVALTGVRSCFVRAVGRPELEMRYAVFSTVLNTLLTVPFAIVFGVVGVVGATAAGLVVASGYFVRLCRPLGLRDRLPGWRFWVAIILAVAVTAAGEFAVSLTGWHGTAPLLVAGVPALAGLGVFGGFMRSLLQDVRKPSPRAPVRGAPAVS